MVSNTPHALLAAAIERDLARWIRRRALRLAAVSGLVGSLGSVVLFGVLLRFGGAA